MPLLTRNPFRRAVQGVYQKLDLSASGQRAVPVPPSYTSLHRDAIPMVEAGSFSNSARFPSNHHTAENRKSHALSIAQALDEKIRVEGWPEEPRKLRNKTLLTWFFNLCEILITLAPIAFLIFAILAAKLDGKPTDGNGMGHNIKVITRLGPSIYPILFAAVAGKSLKTVARYYAERGTQLGVLEMLLASQTVWGTFESQVLLRHFTVVGAHLFLLWCLSPLGGQASLRILETAMHSRASAGDPIVYLPTGAMNGNALSNDILMSGDSATSLAAINALYSSNLLAPSSVKTSSVDTWGNIKVPTLSVVGDMTSSTENWLTVPDLNSADNYTAMAGLPVAGLVKESLTVQEFVFEHAYMDLDCSSPPYNMSQKDPKFIKQLGLVWSSNNNSMFTNVKKNTMTSFFLDTHTPFTDDRMETILVDQNTTTLADKNLQTPRNILFGSQYSGSDDNAYSALMRNCTVKQNYIEAKAKCVEDECKVTALRPSVKYANRNPNLTPLEYYVLGVHFMQYLPLATGSIHSGDTSPTEFYIRGSQLPFGTTTAGLPDMENISNEVFARRMGLLMNTYLQLSFAPLAYTDDLPGPKDPVWQASNLTIITNTEVSDQLTLPPYLPLYSNTTLTRTTEVYKCNYLWFSFLLVSSCILLLLGSAGTALSHLCHAPDMMGYVSSFTYNNPYMRVPAGGEYLGAMERARLLKDVRVKIGDAKVADEVGHVVFATLNRADSVGDLSLSKRYR